jgi:putative ABC transport system substrate-binding protein
LKTGVVLNLIAEGYVRRRDFIKVVAGSMAVWSLAARAQQRPKLPTIGFLGANNATFARSSIDAFVQRLRELGWIENQTVAIEYRWAEGHEERFAEIAAEFVRLKVDVIFTYATPSSIAAKKATAVIPIVFAGAGDPIGTGLVASLARPGGNITGLSIQQTDLASKRLEMLRQVLPAVRTVAILGDIGSPNSVLEMGEAEAAASTLGLAVVTSKLRGAEDIAPAFEALKGRVDALYVCSSPSLTTNRIQINSLALGQRLPTMLANREKKRGSRGMTASLRSLGNAKVENSDIFGPTPIGVNLCRLQTSKYLASVTPRPQTAKPPAMLKTGGFAFSPNDAGLGQAFLGASNWRPVRLRVC